MLIYFCLYIIDIFISIKQICCSSMQLYMFIHIWTSLMYSINVYTYMDIICYISNYGCITYLVSSLSL